MQRKLRWGYGGALVATALLAWACSDDVTHPAGPDTAPPSNPLYGAVTSGNGSGQCMGDDAVSAGFLNLGGDPLALNCTANDISIALAKVSRYRFSHPDSSGSWTTLPSGSRIECTPGQNIWIETSADLANSAQSRYDIGIWIGTQGQADAYTGTCSHYNLVKTATGVADLDGSPGDACGDMSQGTGLATIDLDVMQVTCTDPDNDGVVEVPACVAWQNQINGPERVCQTSDNSTAFRYKTTPDTKSKCNCDPLVLPIDVRSVLRIVKATVPAGSTTNFTFTPTGWNGGATFTRNGTQGAFASAPLASGTYSVTEDLLSGWSLTGRACVLTGTSTAKTFTTPNDSTISVALSNGEDVTCTFTNTQDASVAIQKQTVGGTASFDYTVSGSGLSNFSRNTDPNNPTTASAVTITPAQFGEKYVTETALSGYTLTAINCTANGAVIAIGTGQGGSFAQGTTAGFDSGDNTVKITVDAGDTPTCTFVNTAGSSLDIEKETIGGTDSFDYTVSGGGLSPFSRNTATQGNPTANSPISLTGANAVGEKYVSETAKAGWTLTSITCTAGGADVAIGTGQGGSFNQGTSAGYDEGDNTVKVTLTAGDNPSCTFVNTKDASLDIEKQTVGAAASFSYTGTGDDIPSSFSRNTSPTNPTATAAFAITGDDLGDKYVQETVTAGYALTNIVCTANGADIIIGRGGSGAFVNGGGNGFDAGDNTVKVTVTAGDTPACTFTNTQDASLAIQKETVGATGTFNFVGTGSDVPSGFSRNTGTANPTAEAAFVISGANLGDKYVQETIPAGYAITNITCTANGATIVIGQGGSGAFNQGTTAGYDAGDNTVKVTVGAGNTPTCKFVNTELATLIITKTITGSLDPTALFDFSRTLGATYSTTPSFSPLSNGGSNSSGKVLFPGSYIVCELNVAVALSVSATVDGSPATLTDLSSAGGNTDLCTTVTLTAGQTRTVAFTNNLVVGTGGTRTIGYWKNWASCARGLDGTGQQYLKAIADGGVGIEFTLDGNIGVGEPDIYPIGDIVGPITCEQAVALLNKDAMDGTKRAGDPIYNMVAQLLGAKLNIHAGSGTCDELTETGGYLDRAQTLLDAINFTGFNPAWPKKGSGALSAAQITEANFLAGKLGAYNEGTLGGGCPTHV